MTNCRNIAVDFKSANMNHLAWGGRMAKACRASFKTTPISTDITFIPRAYVYPTPRPKLPNVIHPTAIYERLCTGNMRVESGVVGRFPKIKTGSLF